jgi:hypothetical protein
MNSLDKDILIKYANLFSIIITDENFINYGKFTTVTINKKFIVANRNLNKAFEIKDYFKKKWLENINNCGAPTEEEVITSRNTIEQTFELGTFILKNYEEPNENFNIWFKYDREQDEFGYKINYVDELDLMRKKLNN